MHSVHVLQMKHKAVLWGCQDTTVLCNPAELHAPLLPSVRMACKLPCKLHIVDSGVHRERAAESRCPCPSATNTQGMLLHLCGQAPPVSCIHA